MCYTKLKKIKRFLTTHNNTVLIYQKLTFILNFIQTLEKRLKNTSKSRFIEGLRKKQKFKLV